MMAVHLSARDGFWLVGYLPDDGQDEHTHFADALNGHGLLALLLQLQQRSFTI
jgi:hypothetical protein